LLLYSRRRSLTVLLTPLNSIGRQHVKTFQDAGLECASLFGSSTELERMRTHAAVTSRQLVILVASHEAMVKYPALPGVMKTMGVCLLAVDEAHFFDSWGRWRPNLARAASRLGICRRLALSTTVHLAQVSALQDALHINQPLVVHRGPFLQRNLIIRVIFRNAAYAFGRSNRVEKCRADLEHAQRVAYAFQLAVWCRAAGVNMVVFTSSRSEAARTGAELRCSAEALAQHGRSRIEPLDVVVYHAGLDDPAATKHHFATNTGIVVVATIAFGMCVHCAHVRAVLHFVSTIDALSCACRICYHVWFFLVHLFGLAVF